MKKETIMHSIDRLSTGLEHLDAHGYKSIYSLCGLFDKRRYHVTVYRECDNDILESSPVISGYDNIGIVFQGPLDKNDDFTLNTIRLLRKTYPDIAIVVSTWLGDITNEDRQELESLQCAILESKSMGDEYKGEGQKIGHLNNQLLSSKVGVEYLKKHNIEYAMKIRTDLRIYRIDFIPYLMNLLKLFGRERLINVAFSNSFYNIPYHMSDFIWFGPVDKVLKMYSVPYRMDDKLAYIREYIEQGKYSEHLEKIQTMTTKREFEDFTWYDNLQIDETFLTLFHEECYMPYHYDERKQGHNLLEAYHNFLKQEVIVVDDMNILVFWNKSLYSAVQSNYTLALNGRLSHSKWLELYLQNKI